MTEALSLEYGREQHSRKQRALRRIWYWLWRSAAVLIVLAAVVHTFWLIVATVRLNHAIAALAAAGEPTTPATLQPALPAGTNAYPAIVDAAKIAIAPGRVYDLVDDLSGWTLVPLFDVERRRLRAYVDDRGGAIEPLLDQARAATGNVDPTPLSSPLFQNAAPDLRSMRALALYQSGHAALAHSDGRDDLALRHVAGIDQTAVATASHPGLIGMLVATATRFVQASQLGALAPELRIGQQPGDASPQDVRRQIAALLDSTAIDAELLNALRGERVMQIDTLACVDVGLISSLTTAASKRSVVLRYAARPYVRSNALTCIRLANGVIGTLGAPDWPTAKARLRALPSTSQLGVLDRFARMLTPGFDQAIAVTYRIRTLRSIAAVALAARLYEVETGRPVAAWTDLVPKYLPAMPNDLLAAGRPLQARFGGVNPIVWSVGENGTFAGEPDVDPTTQPVAPNYANLLVHLRPTRRIADEPLQKLIDLDLDAPVPTTAPATQPTATISPAGPSWRWGVPDGSDWDDLKSFTVWGDGAAAKLPTRRDVFVALRFSTPVDPGVPSTNASAAALHGVVRFTNGDVPFDIHAGGLLVLHGPTGVNEQRQMSATPGQVQGFWR